MKLKNNKIMYKQPTFETTDIKENNSYEGEPLERKIERMIENGEEESDGAPAITTERSDGVLPEYNIRTDKWDVALDGMEFAHGTDLAGRNKRIEERKKELENLHNKQKGDNTGAQNQGPEGTSGQSTVAP